MSTEPAPLPSGRFRLSYWWFLAPILLVFTGLAIAGSLARSPYVVLSPGSARGTEPLITVPKDKSHQTKGSILFTTVSVRQHATYAEALYGWLKSDLDVFPYKAIYGDQTRAQNQAEGRQDMNQSKLVAGKVALEELGYTVKTTGTGVLLLDVDASFPSAKVIHKGDTIVAFDGKKVTIDSQLVELIQAHQPGDTVTLTIEPSGTRTDRQVTTTLGRRPNTDVPALGVSIQTRDLNFTLPFPIGIDSGRVGGPSAGLAFTLGVLDRLTPGSITGGHIVAVTGAMSADGQVQQVGGVRQKAVAARLAGSELFIVPTGEYDDALETAGAMKVVKADTLQQALERLAALGGNALELGKPGAPST